MIIWMKKKYIMDSFFHIGFVFYFSAVSYFPQQVVREAKIELEPPLWFQQSAVASWCRSEQQGFFCCHCVQPEGFFHTAVAGRLDVWVEFDLPYPVQTDKIYKTTTLSWTRSDGLSISHLSELPQREAEVLSSSQPRTNAYLLRRLVF